MPTLKYSYDKYDNLTAVGKLVDKTATDPNDQYDTIAYSYEGPNTADDGSVTHSYTPQDHFVTNIIDPRGLKPIQYLYDESGRLIATIDAKGHRIDIAHDPAARTEVVTDRRGNPTIYSYDDRGNVLAVTDTAGATTTYSYDTDSPFNPDRPLSVTTPHKAVDGEVTETSTTAYAYTYYNDPANEPEHVGKLRTQTVTDPVNNRTETTYDTSGNVTQTVQRKYDADLEEYIEVLTTVTCYTATNESDNIKPNQPYLTATRTGEQDGYTWHSISLTFYDIQNRVEKTLQVDVENAELASVFLSNDPASGHVKDHTALKAQTWINAPATYHYFDNPFAEGASPDQPEWIEDMSGSRQYFTYNANNIQTESWTHWQDPANPTVNRYVYTISELDDTGRPVRARQIVDETCPRVEPYLSEIVLSETCYNEIGQTDVTINTDGVVTKYEYDENGQTVETLTYESWTAFAAHYPHYPADTQGLLSISQTLYDVEGRVIVAVGPYDPASPELPVGTETVYDTMGRVSEIRRWQAVQILVEDIAHEGAFVGRKSSDWTTQGAAPVPGGQLSTTRTEYDIAGRTWKTWTQNEDGEMVCTAEYVYDRSGRQTHTISLPGTVDETVTETHYDGARRDYVIDARQNTTSFIYDSLGRVIKTVMPSVSYSYWNAQDQLITTPGNLYQHVGYNGNGQKAWDSSVTAQDEGSHIDSLSDLMHEKLRAKVFGYDTAGRMDYVELPQLDTAESPAYEYFYDPSGNLVAIRDAQSLLTVFRFDEHNRQTHQFMLFVYTGELTDYADIYALDLSSYTYQQTWYDAYGRITQEKDYKGQYTVYTYYTTENNYSSDPEPVFLAVPGQLMAVDYYMADPSVITNRCSSVENTYDRLGRTKTQALLEYAADGVTPTRDDLWTYDYDIEGSLARIDSPQGVVHYDYSPVTGSKIRTWTGPAWETRISITEYVYDDLGRLEEVVVVRRDGEDLATPEVTQYAYDANGNRQSMTLSNNIFTEYTYDALNRLTNLTHYEDNTKADEISSFAYGLYADGSRATVNESLNEDRQIVYQYDTLNRLIQEDCYNSQGYGYTAAYTYNLTGSRLTRTVEVINAEGDYTLSTQYLYYADKPGETQNLDRLWKETNTGPIAAIPYGENQHIYAYTTPGGKITYQMPGSKDQIGQFRAFWIGLPSKWNYVINSTLLILIPLVFFWPILRRWSDNLFAKPAGGDPLSAPDFKIWHRCLCVVLAYIFLVGPEAFQILAQADTQFGQLSTLSWGRGDTIIEYDYDANGSLTTKTTTQGATVTETVTYEYNLQNRLAKVTTTPYAGGMAQNATVVVYKYNPEGIRTAKIESFISSYKRTTYLIDPANPTGYAQVLEEQRSDCPSGTEMYRRRIHYTLGDDVISQTTSTSNLSTGEWTPWATGSTQCLLYDGHGSTRQLIRPDKTLVSSYSYDGYGIMLGGNPTPDNPAATSLLYTGEQFDTALDQYYLRARYYNQSNGTFNRMDDYAGNLQDPQSLHKYLYCHANPVNYIDLSGLAIIDESGGYPYNWTTGIMAHTIFYVLMSLKGGYYDTPVGQLIQGNLIGAGLSLLRPDGVIRKGVKKGFYELKPITNKGNSGLALRVKTQLNLYDLAFKRSGINRGDSTKLLGVLNGKPVGFVYYSGSWYMVRFYAGNKATLSSAGAWKGLVYYSLTKIDYKPPRGGKNLLQPIAVPEDVKENIRIPQLAPITISIAECRIDQTVMMSYMVLATGVGIAMMMQSMKPGAAKAIF